MICVMIVLKNYKKIYVLFLVKNMTEFTTIYQCVVIILLSLLVYKKFKAKNKINNLHSPQIPLPGSFPNQHINTPYAGLS